MACACLRPEPLTRADIIRSIALSKIGSSKRPLPFRLPWEATSRKHEPRRMQGLPRSELVRVEASS